MTTETILDLDSILNESFEGVEAAPEFLVFDNGVYDFVVKKIELKKQEAKDKAKAIAEGKPTEWVKVHFTYGMEAVVQMESDKALPPKVGSMTSENFTWSDKGKPYLKARIAQLVVAAGGSEEDADGMSLTDVINTFPEAVRFRSTVIKRSSPTENGVYEDNRFTNIVPVA